MTRKKEDNKIEGMQAIKIKQLVGASYGNGYTLYALTEDSKVYSFYKGIWYVIPLGTLNEAYSYPEHSPFTAIGRDE